MALPIAYKLLLRQPPQTERWPNHPRGPVHPYGDVLAHNLLIRTNLYIGEPFDPLADLHTIQVARDDFRIGAWSDPIGADDVEAEIARLAAYLGSEAPRLHKFYPQGPAGPERLFGELEKVEPPTYEVKRRYSETRGWARSARRADSGPATRLGRRRLEDDDDARREYEEIRRLKQQHPELTQRRIGGRLGLSVKQVQTRMKRFGSDTP